MEEKEELEETEEEDEEVLEATGQKHIDILGFFPIIYGYIYLTHINVDHRDNSLLMYL